MLNLAFNLVDFLQLVTPPFKAPCVGIIGVGMLQIFLVRRIQPSKGLTLLTFLPSVVHSQEYVPRVQGSICSSLPTACARLYAHARIPAPFPC